MDTSRILPPGREVPTPEDIARLPVTALLLACLDPRFKRCTGWQGFARCPGNAEAFTCRLQTRPGVFGCLREDCHGDDAQSIAAFGLYYFPHPDEPLLDSFSLAAEWKVLADDFRLDVRNFAASPEMCALFRLGGVTLVHRRRPNAFFFRLDAPERDVLILEAGLHADEGWVIPPGQAEQDLPTWTLARELAAVIAGALTFGFACPPAALVRTSLPGQRRLRLADGSIRRETADAPRLRSEGLAWGEGVTGREPALGLPGAEDRHSWMAADDLPLDAVSDPCWQAHRLDRAAMPDAPAAMPGEKRPELIVLTGFLGSGKTSLLLEIVEHLRAHDQFVAIIQNELGATGVDEYVIDGGDTVLSLDEGCVCCSLAGSLASGIKRLTERFHPERIILETSGLANPVNLLATQDTWADLARLEMVVTVIDAVHGLDMLATSDIARDQVRSGDVLVINKCDLVDPLVLDTLRSRLRERNPRAPMVTTDHGQLHPGLLFDAGTDDDLPPSRPAAPLLRRRNHEDEAFSAVRLAQPTDLTREALARWLDALPPDVFRVKGVLRLADADGPQVLQGVGQRWELSPLGRPFADEPFLVCIGRNLAEAQLSFGE